MAYGLKHSARELIDYSRKAYPVTLTSGDAEILSELAELHNGVSLMKVLLTLPQGGIEAILRAQLVDAHAPDEKPLHDLTPQEYFRLVQTLVCKGEAYQKKAAVYAFALPPVDITTLNSTSGTETEQRIPLGKTIVFDGARYTKEQARDIFNFIFANYGTLNSSLDFVDRDFMKTINNGELELSYSVKGYGIWVIPTKNFRKDYNMAEDTSFHVKEGTTRFCVDVHDDFTMPVLWGNFNTRKNGTVAARTEDLPNIIAALEEVQAGKKSIGEALYEPDGKGGQKARFDIYGMDPNFRVDNYNTTPLPLLTDVHAAVTRYRAQPGMTG